MLIKILGPDYVVWDKAATILFKKPGRWTLYARFVIPEEEIALIRRRLETEHSIDRVYTVQLTDAEGVVHAGGQDRLHSTEESGSLALSLFGRDVFGLARHGMSERVGVLRIVGKRLQHQEFRVHKESNRVRLPRLEEHALVLAEEELVQDARLDVDRADSDSA
jgi:hypothetical protein